MNDVLIIEADKSGDDIASKVLMSKHIRCMPIRPQQVTQYSWKNGFVDFIRSSKAAAFALASSSKSTPQCHAL
jgi:uncharacterized protein involved in tolerance to divalent cations